MLPSSSPVTDAIREPSGSVMHVAADVSRAATGSTRTTVTSPEKARGGCHVGPIAIPTGQASTTDPPASSARCPRLRVHRGIRSSPPDTARTARTRNSAVDWALMTDIIPRASAGRYMGLSNVATGAATPIAIALGGVVLDVVTRACGLEISPRVVFVLGVIMYAAVAITLRPVVEPRRGRGDVTG
jgi:hypothetical protein